MIWLLWKIILTKYQLNHWLTALRDRIKTAAYWLKGLPKKWGMIGIIFGTCFKMKFLMALFLSAALILTTLPYTNAQHSKEQTMANVLLSMNPHSTIELV